VEGVGGVELEGVELEGGCIVGGGNGG
jgi:hypothetical protein